MPLTEGDGLNPCSPDAPTLAPPALSPDFGVALGGLLRDLAVLARGTSLDRDTDPRRVLPFLPAALLWRLWPRVLEKASAMASAMPVGQLAPSDGPFMRLLANAIESGAAAPRVGGVPEPRGVFGDGI